MIETSHSQLIAVPIEGVWHYVQDISRWAMLFPGCQSCEILDANRSRWVLKVGAGGMVRTVNAVVEVEQWQGPDQVLFNYRLEQEPVVGSGTYRAVCRGAEGTEITLEVRVEGSGSMAPMWEAMSRPLLPQMAKAFAGKLKSHIEEEVGIAPTAAPSVWVRFKTAICRWWHRLTGKSSAA